MSPVDIDDALVIEDDDISDDEDDDQDDVRTNWLFFGYFPPSKKLLRYFLLHPF